MGRVDREDQLHGYYSCKIKSYKLYKNIFFLFNVTITNKYILDKLYHNQQHFKNKNMPYPASTSVDRKLF